jgi:phage tail sheath protein FI
MVVPGIYVQEQRYNLNPLKINSQCITGFVGISELGPINKPVLIKNFDEYLMFFGGFDTAGILPYSVHSYFRNGGKECVVVRVADEENIKSATYKIKTDKGCIKFRAKSPGKWGNFIIVNIWKENENFFSLTLEYKSKTESFIHLSYENKDERYFESYINKNSSLCKVTTEGIIESIEPIFRKTFSGGKDGISSLTAKHFIGKYNGLNNYAGIGCFESRDDISLISVPDLCWLKNENEVYAVNKALIEQAERFQDRFAILDIPKQLDCVKAREWAVKLRSPFAAAYYSYIDVTDPLDISGTGTIRLPPSGAVCGCIAAIDGEKGVYHPPANCILEGAVGISNKTTTGEQEILYTSKINILKYFPGRGVKIWGAKTLSCDKEWEYINVRRTFSRVCSALKKGTQWAVFEPNDKNLRKRLVRQVSGFLLDLWRDGYFAGSTPEQGFYVRCDEELNPPENIDLGILVFEVGMAIIHPTEFFKITLTAEKDGASVYLQE